MTVSLAPETSRHANWSAAAALAPFLVALLVGALAVIWTGNSPFEFYALLTREAFLGVSRVGATLTSTTPLIFTGVATLIAFRAGVFNIGVEGSFIAGAFTAAIVGSSLDLPGPVQISLAMLAASAVGLVAGWVPGWLKARLGVDEVVTTLMGNFVVAGVVAWLVSAYFLAPGTGNVSTPLVMPQTRLPSLIPGTQLTISLIAALAMTVAVHYWLRRSLSGFEVRMVGSSARFAWAQGISVPGVIIYSMVLSGLIGGLAGGAFTLGTLGRYVVGGGANLGFNGIAVALLARLHPIAVVPSALVLGALAAAGPSVQLFMNVPLDVVRIMQGTIMIVAVIPVLVGRWSKA